MQTIRALSVAGLSFWLAACNTTSNTASNTTSGTASIAESQRAGAGAYAAVPPPSSMLETTGSITPRAKSELPRMKTEAKAGETEKDNTPRIAPLLPGSDGTDDIAKGREQFRAGEYAQAEVSFQRAAQMNPRAAEAWLGLAACYDNMRRFELADRAYAQAMSIKGPTSEILNNQGYSYLLRGDLKRARNTLTAAKNKDPRNQYVRNNLQLVAQKERTASAAQLAAH